MEIKIMKKATTFLLAIVTSLFLLSSCAGQYKCTDSNNFFNSYVHQKE